jgi:hypothetical protein
MVTVEPQVRIAVGLRVVLVRGRRRRCEPRAAGNPERLLLEQRRDGEV